MGLTVYPARIIDQEDGTKLVDALLPFEAQDQEILRPEALAGEEFEGDAFLPNPEFLPGAGFSLSYSSWAEICRRLNLDYPGGASGILTNPDQVIQSCWDFLQGGMGCHYTVHRTVQLLNVAQIAHTRGGVIGFG